MGKVTALEVLARERGRVESWLRVVSAFAVDPARRLAFFVNVADLRRMEMARKKLRRYRLEASGPGGALRLVKGCEALSFRSLALELERLGATEQDVDNAMDLQPKQAGVPPAPEETHTYAPADGAFRVTRLQ